MMIKKRKLLPFLIFSMLISTPLYSIEGYENFEDSYIQISAKKIKDDFFMVKYDYDNEEVYIGMNALFYFMELYGLEVNIGKKSISGKLEGKNLNVSFSDDEAYVLDEELFVNSKALERKMNFSSIKYDFSSLRLTLDPNFILPYEEREKGKVERLRLDSRKEEEKKIDIEVPRKFITPGLLKLDYSQSDIKKPENHLSYEYASQFLYGELYLSGGIRPESELTYGNLTYSDIVGDNDLILGNFSLIAPSFLNIDGNILGVSFNNEETYVTKDGAITVIKGEAFDADIIELYRNGMLLSYISPHTKDFEFRIDDGILSSDYTLKIYYKNGGIEERTVYSLSDSELLKKGRYRFSAQSGKNADNGDPQSIIKTFYGVADNFTIGVSGSNLTSTSGRKYKFLENTFLLSTGLHNFPTLINYKNFYEIEKKENSYNLSVEQKLFTYNLKFTENKYSPYVYEDTNLKKYNSISIGKNFNRNSFEFGLNRYVYYNTNIESKNIYSTWYSSLFNPVSFSLRMEKELTKDNEGISFYPSFAYSGFQSLNMMLDGEISKKRTDDEYKQKYSLRINKRNMELIKDTLFVDFGVEAKYSNETEKFRYGITFTIELDDFIYLEAPTNVAIDENNNRKTTTGLHASKIIDLSNPIRKIKNNVSITGAWIHGKVFLDKNGNGIFDEGDIPIPEAGVMVNNKTFLADEDGNYVAEGVATNEIIDFTINRKTIDPMMKNSKGALKIKTRKSSGLKVDIPIEVVSMVTGNIWNTSEFTERQFIQAVSMTTIVLEKDGQVQYEVDPEFDGMFFFEDIPPGQYKMKFIYLGQENFGFTTSELDVDVTLTDTETGEYFEGYDTQLMRKVEEETTQETTTDMNEDEMDDILNNY